MAATSSKLVSGFPNFHFAESPRHSYAELKKAVDYIRAGHGPAFVHGHVIRPYSHSLPRFTGPTPSGKRRWSAIPITRFQVVPDARRYPRLEKASTNWSRTSKHEIHSSQRPRGLGAVRRAPVRTRSSFTRPTSIPHRRHFRPRRCIPTAVETKAPRKSGKAPWPTSSMSASTTRCAAIRAL